MEHFVLFYAVRRYLGLNRAIITIICKVEFAEKFYNDNTYNLLK